MAAVAFPPGGYDSLTKDDAFTRSVLKVRPEAADYPSQAKRDTVGQLISEAFTLSGPPSARRQPKQEKNHIEENVKRMRRIQRERKTTRQVDGSPSSSAGPMKALWKSEKYASVSSKVAAELQKPELAPEKTYSTMTAPHKSDAGRPRSAGSCYLRAHSRTGIPADREEAESGDAAANGIEKLNLSRTSSCDNLSRLRDSSNFVKINGIAASQVPPRRSPRVTAAEEQQREKAASYELWKKKNLGSVPA